MCVRVLWMFGTWNNRNLHVVTHVQMLQMISKNGWSTRLDSLVRTGMVWNAHMLSGQLNMHLMHQSDIFLVQLSWLRCVYANANPF